jgi:hypothetical protein
MAAATMNHFSLSRKPPLPLDRCCANKEAARAGGFFVEAQIC